MPPRTRTVLALAGAAVLLVALVLELAVPAHHGAGWQDHWYHHVPGLHALLGFGGAWLLVAVSKGLGKAWLQRPEDYYGEADPEADDPEPPPRGDRHE